MLLVCGVRTHTRYFTLCRVDSHTLIAVRVPHESGASCVEPCGSVRVSAVASAVSKHPLSEPLACTPGPRRRGRDAIANAEAFSPSRDPKLDPKCAVRRGPRVFGFELKKNRYTQTSVKRVEGMGLSPLRTTPHVTTAKEYTDSTTLHYIAHSIAHLHFAGHVPVPQNAIPGYPIPGMKEIFEEKA